MALKYVFTIIMLAFVKSEMCPKQCDCDLENGLNRALCVDQNIISIDVGVPNIVQIYSLSHNVISELDNFCFKNTGYTSIRVLNLSYNLIFWIGLHAFSGLEQLINLDLSNNRLRFIPSDLFWDTPQLQILDLSGNIFENIKNEPFLIHSNLQVLNLNNCRIKYLPERLFTRLPNLKKMDLSDNYIISTKIEVFKPLRKLQRLELRNDYIQCNKEFIALENWVVSHDIAYDKLCKKVLPKMFEKMILAVTTEREQIDVNKVWNTSIAENETLPELKPSKPLTPVQKFDKEFSSLQAFIIGLELGLGIGIIATYIWLRNVCKCGKMNCRRPQTRRQRRRAQRIAEAEIRSSLLWNTIIHPDLETPPLYRRGLSLPDGSIGDAPFQVDAIRLPDRSETPPPPYHQCRINL